MTSREFCYWLQGFFEINEATFPVAGPVTELQVGVIRKHLALVFKHEIDPSYPNQDELNKIHNPTGNGSIKGTKKKESWENGDENQSGDTVYRC